MTTRPVPDLDRCDYYTETDGRGQFTGRVKEFPELRTRKHKKSIDALGEIVDLTRDRIADREDEIDLQRGRRIHR